MREEVHKDILCESGSHLVIVHNRHWLPLETAYHEEIATERRRGRRLGQVMFLSGRGNWAGLLRLFRHVWQRAVTLRLDTVFVAVSESDLPFYRRFAFVPAEWGTRRWDFADYAPVVVARLDLKQAARHAEAGLRRRFVQPLSGHDRAWLCQDEQYEAHMARWDRGYEPRKEVIAHGYG